MSHRQEVVVVDGLPETAQVLRTVLEPRGLSVTRRRTRQVPLDDSASPRVLVLHDVTDPDANGPCVIVGRIVDSTGEMTERNRRSLAQPFHYADLIAAIDAVIERPAA